MLSALRLAPNRGTQPSRRAEQPRTFLDTPGHEAFELSFWKPRKELWAPRVGWWFYDVLLVLLFEDTRSRAGLFL